MEGGVWGLVIIFSAFMIQFLAFGSSICIGVYNIELLEHFPDNTVGVSLIASLNFGILLGSGPVVSFLMTKFSFRKIAVFGSALVVLGLLGMRLFPYIPTMCFCFGLMCGFGSCCTYIPSHVLSGMYYDKNRSLATGVATSGSGLGGAVMPIVAGLLIETYSWKGSLIVVAGLCLHLFVFSALLRMPEQVKVVERVIGDLQDISSPLKMLPQFETNSKLHINTNKVSESSDSCKTSCVHMESKPLISGLDANEASDEKVFHEISQDNVVKSVDQSSPTQISVKDSGRAENGSSSIIQSHTAFINSQIKGRKESSTKLDENGPTYSRHIYIFTNYGFNVYFLSNVMWNVGSGIVASFMPEYLHNQGLSSTDAAFLFGVLGFGNFIGGVLGGILGNFRWVNRQILYTVTNIFLGVVLAAFPAIGHRDLFMLWMLVFGLAFGMILGLLVIVLTDLIGIDSLSNGLGYLMLSHGIGCFIGPPLAGALKEATGDFGPGIVLSGVMCVCSGLVMLLLPFERFLGKLCFDCSKCCHGKRQSRFQKDITSREENDKCCS